MSNTSYQVQRELQHYLHVKEYAAVAKQPEFNVIPVESVGTSCSGELSTKLQNTT